MPPACAVPMFHRVKLSQRRPGRGAVRPGQGPTGRGAAHYARAMTSATDTAGHAAAATDPHASIYDHGFVRVAAVTLPVALADPAANAERHLEVLRDGDTVIARTHHGRDRRVLLAGHLDTVPVAANLPSTRRVREGREELVGRGTCDMKGGVAVMLKLAVEAADAPMDLTCQLYIGRAHV